MYFHVNSIQYPCCLTIIWYYAVQSVGDDDNWEIRSQPASFWRDDMTFVLSHIPSIHYTSGNLTVWIKPYI